MIAEATTVDFISPGVAPSALAGKGARSESFATEGLRIRAIAGTRRALFLLPSRGLGVDDLDIGPGEALEILFDIRPARAVTLVVASASNGGARGTPAGSRRIEAFGADGAALGSVAQSGTGTFSIAPLFGGTPIARLVLTATDGDLFTLGAVGFLPALAPAPLAAPGPRPALPTPVTPAPVTPAPVTPAPVTHTPVTQTPIPGVPVTHGPVTPVPLPPAAGLLLAGLGLLALLRRRRG